MRPLSQHASESRHNNSYNNRPQTRLSFQPERTSRGRSRGGCLVGIDLSSSPTRHPRPLPCQRRHRKIGSVSTSTPPSSPQAMPLQCGCTPVRWLPLQCGSTTVRYRLALEPCRYSVVLLQCGGCHYSAVRGGGALGPVRSWLTGPLDCRLRDYHTATLRCHYSAVGGGRGLRGLFFCLVGLPFNRLRNYSYHTLSYPTSLQIPCMCVFTSSFISYQVRVLFFTFPTCYLRPSLSPSPSKILIVVTQIRGLHI